MYLLGYDTRNRILRKLGYKSYRLYLGSALWKRVKKKVLKAANHTCQICRDPAEVVHHDYYSRDNLTGCSLDGLWALCHDCHGKLEREEGRKTHLFEAGERFRTLRIKNRKPVVEATPEFLDMCAKLDRSRT